MVTRRNKRYAVSILLSLLITAMILTVTPSQPSAQTGPTLVGSTFFGGSGDQRGTDISIINGAIYLSGNAQQQQQSSDSTLVIKYSSPSGSSPVWSRVFTFGTNFYGITATNEGVYAGGWSYDLTTDPGGGKEVKSILAKFWPDGSPGSGPGGSIWVSTPNFFPYGGVEHHTDVTNAVEGGNTFIYATGGGQPFSYFAPVTAKYDTLGNLLAQATDPANQRFSSGSGVVVLNGYIYTAGYSQQDVGNIVYPTIWKHEPGLNVVWKRFDASGEGDFLGITAFGGYIYAVGATRGTNPDFIAQKYDEDGNKLWGTTFGGANTGFLTDVVAVGDRLFAVGYTDSEGSGGFDAVVIELDPETGNVLSTTLFGGAQDDKANRVATDGTDLYVLGESRSFASVEGNAVGQNDLMLLRYTLAEPNQPPVADAGPDQTVFNEVTLDGIGSSDPDGTIVSYDWELKHRVNYSFDRIADGENPTVQSLEPGFYDVTFTVTDDDGLTGADTVLLAVSGQCSGEGLYTLEELQQYAANAVATAEAAKDLIINDLTAQLAAANANIAALEVAKAELETQLAEAEDKIEYLTQSLQSAFTVTIPGDSPEEQIENLVTAIESLPPGQRKNMVKNW